MSDEPISFTGRLGLQDLLDIHSCHVKVMVRGTIRLLFIVFSLIFAAVIITAGILTGFQPAMFLGLALCAYFPFGWWLTDRIRVRKNYTSQPEKFIDHTVVITHDSVYSGCVTGETRLDWSQIHTVIDAPQGLLFLLPGNSIWIWLPQRLFLDHVKRETILDLARHHSVAVRRMA